MPDIDQSTIDQIARDIRSHSDNVKALDESTRRELQEMRSVIDQHGKRADALVDERVNKFAASIETKTGALETGLKEVSAQAERIEAVLKRPNAAWKGEEGGSEISAAFDFHRVKMAKEGRLAVGVKVDPQAADNEAYNLWAQNFSTYLRRDERAVPQAALSTGSDPDGGYLVPTTVSSRVINRVYETSPLRQYATVETISGKELVIPRDEGEFGSGWVGETESRPETTTSQVGESKIMAHELYAAPRVTQSMIEDAGLDIESWMGNKVGDKFARAEATAFINGTGINQPRGLLTYASGTANGQIERIVSGNATLVTADGIKDLVYSLKDYYTANARFMMKRLTVRDVVKLKDGQNNYLWQMGDIKGGQPSTLEGYPVVRAEDFPSIGAGTLPIAFGDFRAAYTIIDRLGINVLRDPFTAKPYVIMYTRRRVGGDVVNFEAVKLQVIST
jgi:HK97 family phage major capsid protein